MTISAAKLSLATRWSKPNGYRQVLLIAFPLILSTGSWSIQQFVDRMFLSWYSPDALAAAMPTGILSFTIVCFFIGTAGYASTFVAQYTGAGRHDRVGPAMWQGIYFSLIGGIVTFIAMFFAEPIFQFIGHDESVRELEIKYWRYLTIGGFFPICMAAVSSFFNGRGNTFPVMWASLLATCLNMVLNYLLIFGNFGLPEMGISGAGLSTVISQIFNLSLLLFMTFMGNNNAKYKTISGWKFDKDLFLRLIRYGLPNGIHFFLDIAAFSAFILIVGRLGAAQLAATNIALNVSMLAFMPMIGMGITVSILVGQSLGANNDDMADTATTSAVQMAFIYMGSISALYLLIPSIFIYPFAANADPTEFEEIRGYAMTAMKFVAAWSLVDSLGIVYSSALKGAGDTRFTMYTIIVLSLILLILPTFIALELMGWGLEAAWAIGVVYIIGLAVTFTLRYRAGKWRTMRVIEQSAFEDPLQT